MLQEKIEAHVQYFIWTILISLLHEKKMELLHKFLFVYLKLVSPELRLHYQFLIHLVIMLHCHAIGIDNRSLLVIGKSVKPRCFKILILIASQLCTERTKCVDDGNNPFTPIKRLEFCIAEKQKDDPTSY